MLGLTRRNPSTPVWREGESNIARWDPWGDFNVLLPGVSEPPYLVGAPSPLEWVRRVDQEFDRLFTNFFEGWSGPTATPVPAWAPRIEVQETPEEYLIHAELPGVNPEDIEVTTTGPVLSIQGRTRQEWQEEQNGGTRSARQYGSFQRSFPLPPTVQADAIAAEYHQGLLQIHLPKTEEARQQYRRIPILTGEASAQPALVGETVGASEAGAAGEEVLNPEVGKTRPAKSTRRRAPKSES